MIIKKFENFSNSTDWTVDKLANLNKECIETYEKNRDMRTKIMKPPDRYNPNGIMVVNPNFNKILKTTTQADLDKEKELRKQMDSFKPYIDAYLDKNRDLLNDKDDWNYPHKILDFAFPNEDNSSIWLEYKITRGPNRGETGDLYITDVENFILSLKDLELAINTKKYNL